MEFLVGLVSGIVSSLLVTMYYRYKDSERDRQKYFTSLRRYTSELIAISTKDIEAIRHFYFTNERPPIYKWVRLKRDEWKIVYQLDDKLNQLGDVLISYIEDDARLIENELERKVKYDGKIAVIITEIRLLRLEDILPLGNKILTEFTRGITASDL